MRDRCFDQDRDVFVTSDDKLLLCAICPGRADRQSRNVLETAQPVISAAFNDAAPNSSLSMKPPADRGVPRSPIYSAAVIRFAAFNARSLLARLLIHALRALRQPRPASPSAQIEIAPGWQSGGVRWMFAVLR